jgi:hypothetical protein
MENFADRDHCVQVRGPCNYLQIHP